MTIVLYKKCKVFVYLKSFYYNYLVRDLKNLFIFLKKNKLDFLTKKIIYLPSKIKKFSVVKSPFVSKLDKEQFEIRIYKVLIIWYLHNNLLVKFFRTKKLFNMDHSYFKICYFY